MTEPPVCDFCSSPDVRWAFRCENLRGIVQGLSASDEVTMTMPWHSVGDWAACPACKALIMRGDRKRLAHRSARRLCHANPSFSFPLALQTVAKLHDAFFKYRVGNPLPVSTKGTA